MVDWTRDSRVEVYAQNMHYAPEGPFTGEVSAPMLLEAGVHGVIVGHSERRRLFAESDTAVQLKVAAAVASGLVPILCVGESEEQCQLGETEHVVCQQLRSGLELVDATRLGDVVIAYEPIWTIGTGRMAALEHTQEVGALVRRVVAERSSEQANADAGSVRRTRLRGHCRDAARRGGRRWAARRRAEPRRGPLLVDPQRRAQLATAAPAVRTGSCADGHNSPHAPSVVVWACPVLTS
jgi:triosephosphate isomerase